MAVVETRYGSVEGIEAEGLQIFKGIAYARSPAGPMRWRPPEPPAHWSGVRPARAFGPCSWQPAELPDLLTTLVSTAVPFDEDCLTLNIWTPGVDTLGRPVMVWIHGGAFFIGSGSQSIYDEPHWPGAATQS